MTCARRVRLLPALWVPGSAQLRGSEETISKSRPFICLMRTDGGKGAGQMIELQGAF
jgi:hypothetical protein